MLFFRLEHMHNYIIICIRLLSNQHSDFLASPMNNRKNMYRLCFILASCLWLMALHFSWESNLRIFHFTHVSMFFHQSLPIYPPYSVPFFSSALHAFIYDTLILRMLPILVMQKNDTSPYIVVCTCVHACWYKSKVRQLALTEPLLTTTTIKNNSFDLCFRWNVVQIIVHDWLSLC